MKYKQLSLQYFSQYKSLSAYIKKLRHQLKITKLPSDIDQLQHRISLLYTICLELKHTSKYLENCERRDKNAIK